MVMFQPATRFTSSERAATFENEIAPEVTQINMIECSGEEILASTGSEDQTFLHKPTSSPDKSSESNATSPPKQQTKVLFLDGARGLAAMLVVVQHSQEFMPDLHLGSVGVDVFFVLSSFLLTWIFTKKSMKLLAEGASVRTWKFTMIDYFQKRFFRVYPLFFVTVIVLSLLKTEDKQRYFVVHNEYNMLKVLTFDFDYRYHVFWTLPLEIAYYFVIPIFVLVVLGMRRYWWLSAVPLTVWVVYEGIFVYRTSHMPMRPHISTFVTGSLAAVVFVKLDLWIQRNEFKFRWWHMLLLRTVEALAIAMLLSVCFRGLLFDWVHENPAPPPKGFPYTSAFLAIVFVIEMIKPSCVSTMLEWNILRFWGKISFSVYLLHTFVIENPNVSHQHNYFDRFFSRLILIMALATTTYHLVEYPSQLMAQAFSRFLATQQKKSAATFVCMRQTIKN